MSQSAYILTYETIDNPTDEVEVIIKARDNNEALAKARSTLKGNEGLMLWANLNDPDGEEVADLFDLL